MIDSLHLHLSALMYVIVKGIWKNPPPGWPSDIEFVDPNNNMKASVGSTSRKPKKELLIPMLQHLVAKFQVSFVTCV